MKRLTLLLFLLPTLNFAQTSITPLDCIEPFYHNVASGDPLSDRVIIWTRVTPDDFTLPVNVDYAVALDTGMTNIVAQGSISTDALVDYTVKVDVTGLEPQTYYYYEFKALGNFSPRGRTKTAPLETSTIDSLRFAVVSCANLEAGYFNAYEALAERNDVEAILMLGDYIYEYEEGGYAPNSNVDRVFDPTHEILTLNDYRLRYSVYHMDQALQKLHQNFPWICVWDDHESANDSYEDGAENHNAGEGQWADRKLASQMAFFEWLPIRPKSTSNLEIFRKFNYGNLLDLIMVDTRLHGREEQGVNQSDPDRTLLGDDQYEWLEDELLNSTAKWKVLGNQVVFAPIEVFGTPINNDAWDGYPAERQNLLDFVVQNNIDNFTVLTGDIHTSWAFNLENGAANVGIEFVTPSITSPGLPINAGPLLQIENPHIKYVDLVNHGFIILDINSQRIQSDWYFVNTLDAIDASYSWGKSLYSNDGAMNLQETTIVSTASSAYDIDLAPQCPRSTLGTEEQYIGLIGIYPNPVSDELTVHFAWSNHGQHVVEVLDLNGKILQKEAVNTIALNSANKTLDVSMLNAGVYLLRIWDSKGNVVSSKFVKQ
ncbi:MAG: alkaline phosphatase D family protein [Crocinitomicaceae bacterium]|nr:alkaline phosphatase D family protein [Flavobacteriales bacterium]NQZ38036.1 alkaline phosphatase D family protein [Crocinitomicaceae bacterium]